MAAVIQRPLRGSRVATFYPVKNLPSLASLDSAFQLQEYISLLIRLDVHDVDAIVSFPGSLHKDKDSPSDKDAESKTEVTVDEGCWIYEQLRRLAQDLSHPLITTLQQECTRASCPEMKAGEWLYLCVAHGNDGAMEQCCAIDYILHTVDSATALLNSPRTFPSRLSIPQTSHRHFASLARRLGRIFAHAYYHHREAFEQAEAESSLYARFLALTSKFDLVPAEFLVIPSSHYAHEDTREREREQAEYEYGDHGRGYQHQQRQQREQQQREREHVQSSNKFSQQEQLGLGGPTHAQPSAPSENNANNTSPSPNGGIGESPSVAASRSRFGRNRTDTMVFADAEASAIAEELAAKARAGLLEPDYDDKAASSVPEHESEPVQQQQEGEDADDADLDGDTQFEISLSPEEEISPAGGSFAETDIGDLPIHIEKNQAPSPDVPEPVVEPEPEPEAQEQETPSIDIDETKPVEKPVEEVQEESAPVAAVEDAKTSTIDEHVPSKAIEEAPVAEPERAASPSPPSSEDAPAPASPTTVTAAAEELHEIVHEVKEESTSGTDASPAEHPGIAESEPTNIVSVKEAEVETETAPVDAGNSPSEGGLPSQNAEPEASTPAPAPAPAHADEAEGAETSKLTPAEPEVESGAPEHAAVETDQQDHEHEHEHEHKSYAEAAAKSESGGNENQHGVSDTTTKSISKEAPTEAPTAAGVEVKDDIASHAP